jgi:hypothetical protein
MINAWRLQISVVWILGSTAVSAEAANRFEARVVDDASGRPLAARVAVADVHGKFVEIEGDHAHVDYLQKRWCYVDGGFSLTLPAGGVSLEVRRGFETLPFTERVTDQDAGGTIRRTFRLRRWRDLGAEGYMQGDIHAHLPVPAEAHWQMRAEDLNALTLLYLPATEDPIAVNGCFTGKLDRHSTPGCEILVGEEIQDFHMGHLNLIGLNRLLEGYDQMGGGLEYWRTAPHWDLSRAVRQARAQDATIVWAHMSSLPGQQLPVALALGWLDAIELVTWNDPAELPNHWGPWLSSGFPQAEFPVLRGVDLYYQCLNAGFRVPLAAGTDKFFEEIPLGSNRTYAKVAGHASHSNWLAGIRAGRGFVSNGPLLEFDVDGRQSGDVVSFSEPCPIRARVTARSILPFNTLEIVCNGSVIGHKTVPPPHALPDGGVYALSIETTATLDRSSWIAARVIDHPDLRNRILPRNLSVFAHSGPVYFLRDGRDVREQASIDYLRRYVEGFVRWLDTRPPFFREEDREQARRDAELALRFYRDR